MHTLNPTTDDTSVLPSNLCCTMGCTAANLRSQRSVAGHTVKAVKEVSVYLCTDVK